MTFRVWLRLRAEPDVLDERCAILQREGVARVVDHLDDDIARSQIETYRTGIGDCGQLSAGGWIAGGIGCHVSPNHDDRV